MRQVKSGQRFPSSVHRGPYRRPPGHRSQDVALMTAATTSGASTYPEPSQRTSPQEATARHEATPPIMLPTCSIPPSGYVIHKICLLQGHFRPSRRHRRNTDGAPLGSLCGGARADDLRGMPGGDFGTHHRGSARLARAENRLGCWARLSHPAGFLKRYWPHMPPTVRRLRRRRAAITSGSRRSGLVGRGRMRRFGGALVVACVLLLAATQYADAQDGPYVGAAAGWKRTNADYTKGIGLDVPPASYETATNDARRGAGVVRAALGYRTFVADRPVRFG